MKWIYYLFILSVLTSCTVPKKESSEELEKKIHFILDDWHKAVAEYDDERYFGYMTNTSRFLGTDESERWTKAEFMEFSMPYFKKESTWDFKPEKRKLFLSNDLQYAWFDEVLDTWMGPCRGSGILRIENDTWKIEQYNLAILVPNAKVNEYLDIIGKPRKDQSGGEE